MRKLTLIFSTVLLFTLAGSVDVFGQIGQTAGLQTINQYFDLLEVGNIEIAADMWAPEVLERSKRFDIVYTGIPLKVDCSSPIMRDLELMRHHLQPPIRNYEIMPGDNWSRLQYSRVVRGKEIEYYYWAQRRGDWFWLSFPQEYYCADWPVVESKYFRIHAHPDVVKYLNPAVLKESDRFIEAMVDTLDIPGSKRKQIEQQKIEYFYCPSDQLVDSITGSRDIGMLDPATNDIISSVFPYFHELVRLLVNIKLEEIPLYTIPVMQEGMAVRYGGQWGKSPSVLINLAVFLYKEELVTIDSILTMKSFNSDASMDIVYPVAGVFCAYLVDEMGLDRVFDLYRDLSGPYDSLAAMSAENVQAKILAHTGHADWEALMCAFDVYLHDRLDRHAAALPGRVENGKVILQGDGFTVTESADWVGFEFAPGFSVGPAHGNLLFAPREDLAGHVSSLFEEQYAERVDMMSFRFGVRYDQYEAGLYDYATNQLLAKYIWGISPSEDYFVMGENRVSVKFRKSLFEGHLPRPDGYKRLSN